MFFLASKIFWALAQPSNLLLLLLAAGTLALLLGRRRLASWLLYPAVLVFLLVGLFPVGEWLILPLENRFPAPAELPDDVDGIIVLGGAVDLEVTQARGVVAFHGEAERDISFARTRPPLSGCRADLRRPQLLAAVPRATWLGEPGGLRRSGAQHIRECRVFEAAGITRAR